MPDDVQQRINRMVERHQILSRQLRWAVAGNIALCFIVAMLGIALSVEIVLRGNREGQRTEWASASPTSATESQSSAVAPATVTPSAPAPVVVVPAAIVSVPPAVSKPPWASDFGHDEYGTWADLTIVGMTQRFRLINPGTFMMGSPPDEDGHTHMVRGKTSTGWESGTDEEQHQVTITNGFWLADSECTKNLWASSGVWSVAGHETSPGPSSWQRPAGPMSYGNCQEFLDKLNSFVEGLGARLPTEAEWEYACRAGTTGPFNGTSIDAVAWYGDNWTGDRPEGAVPGGNSGDQLHPVKQKASNAWGLYDMLGNMPEWCSDWYEVDFSPLQVKDPTGPAIGSAKVLRGGSWKNTAEECRSASRQGVPPDMKAGGFRICIPSGL